MCYPKDLMWNKVRKIIINLEPTHSSFLRRVVLSVGDLKYVRFILNQSETAVKILSF